MAVLKVSYFCALYQICKYTATLWVAFKKYSISVTICPCSETEVSADPQM